MKAVILDWATVTCDNDLSIDAFKRLADITSYDLTEPEKTVERIGDAQMVLCNKVPITRDVIRQCSNLKYIGLFATGYNNIDMKAADEYGVVVSNAGSYSTEAVAQQVFAYILDHYNKVNTYNNDVKNGKWIESKTFSYFPYTIHELHKKTLAVIGYGSIGRAVAKLGAAFGMKVIVATRTLPKDCPYGIVSISEAFKVADVLTVHCPLTPKTKELVCKERLKTMKKDAILINTSRGPVVNENDLADALNDGVISAAYLDVLCAEPMSKDTPLINAKNCIITPHVAWAAVETRKRLVKIAADNLKAYIEGHPQNQCFFTE